MVFFFYIAGSLEGMLSFGVPHFDSGDAPGGLTVMVSNSDLPQVNDGSGEPAYEPGRFHLLAFGFYIKLTPLRVMCFSGLFKHGGSPPLSPPGVTCVPWAYRFMTVLYPPEVMLSPGHQLVALAALPDRSLLRLAPEMSLLMYVHSPILPSYLLY